VVTAGETLKFKSIEPEQHFTEPPPRFTEATLVKELESDGVGRRRPMRRFFRPFRNAST
jgi:DNA topoisomerase-1